MAAGVIANTYGHALFELAVEQDEIDSFLEEAGVIKNVLESNPDFQKLLTHPRVDVDKKIHIVESCFSGKVSDDMTGFLVILVQNNRQKEIIAALDEFTAEVKEYRRIGVCRVVSALELTGQQKERLEKRILETTGYQSLETDHRTDRNLIGGLTIQIGDRVLDSSIRTQLNELQKSLQQVSIDE